jgi:predicted phage terminase large subunit-like protein
LLKRRVIRRDLTEWCRHSGYEPAAHHRLIIRELEAVRRGETDRLALFLPPGSAKSTYASVLFPPWYLADDPSRSIIAASHTSELAERWGRKVRNQIAEHALALGYNVADDNKAAGRWETQDGGEYYAAGVGGSITGRRADLAIIDDPIRSREDADSKKIRDAQWEWYKFDLATRLKPNASVVLIQTRWHEDDLAGRLLNEERDRWKVVSIPMEATADDLLDREPGELLWPEWYTPQMALDAKRDPRLWSALYQQQPTPDEGAFFKADWFRTVPKLPPLSTLRIYGGSDYAVTSDGGDYTVHVVVGIDPDNRMYVVDMWRRQSASDEWVEAFCDLVRRWKPMAWAEEQGQIRSGVGPFLERRMRDRQAFVMREQFPTRGDKAVRSQSIRGRMALDGLYIAQDAPWKADLIGECLRFPAGVHDDQVDALGLVGQLLDKMVTGQRPDKNAIPKRESGYGVRDFSDAHSVLTL